MDIICLGELLVDMLPAETGRRLGDVSAFMPKPGGSPANVSVAAARLGVSTAFIGKVGDDFFGHSLEEALRREGVETRGMRFDTDTRTTLAFVAQPDAHRNEYVFYRNPGADQRLRPDELDHSLLTNTHVLYVGSLSLSDEPCRSATFEAVHIAKAAGAFIMFDVHYRPSLWRTPDEALEQILAMLRLADLVKANELELELVTGTTNTEQGSAKLLEYGPKQVVVTLGAAGSYYRNANASGIAPGFKVNAIDSTGCGDSFNGALLSQLTRRGISDLDSSMARAVEYANAAGALTSTRRGAIPAMPTPAEVEQLLSKQRQPSM